MTVQELSRELEIMSGFRRSHAYTFPNDDPLSIVRLQHQDISQPLSVLLRDVTLGPIPSLVGGHLIFRDPNSNEPKRLKIVAATVTIDHIELHLTESTVIRDGDDVCVEWPH